MTATQATILARAITNCENYKIFRQKRSGSARKWQKKFDQLCSQIGALSHRLEQGDMIDEPLLRSVTQRIDRISKNVIIPEQQQRLLKEKERLLCAEMAGFNTSFTQSAAPLFLECSTSAGIRGWLARSLYLQSAVGANPLLLQVNLTRTTPSSLASAPVYPAPSDAQMRCVAHLYAATQMCPAKLDASTKTGPRSGVDCRFASLEGNDAKAPIVVDQKHLGGIAPGSWCFFSHISKITHFIICSGQKIFGATWQLARNVTHVGIVEKVDGSVVHISEIPAYGAAVSTNPYDLKAMKEGESLLFVSPDELVSEMPANGLTQAIRYVARQIAPAPPVPEENQYDVMGAAMAVLRPAQFSESDKRDLIDGYIDYLYGRKQKKDYFCSQFVMEFTQLGRIIQKFPDVHLVIKNEIKGIDVQDAGLRASAIRRIIERLETRGIWDEISEDPIFRIPPRSSTPASMLALAAPGALITRVTNPVSVPHFDPSPPAKREAYPEFIEYTATQLLIKYHEGQPISVRDPEIQNLFAIMEKELGYSRKTLTCVFERCMTSEDAAGCVGGCLHKTLTWKEKINIFFISIGLNRAVGRLLKNPDFIRFVRDPKPDQVTKFIAGTTKESFIGDLLSIAFPMRLFHPMVSLENYFIRRAARSYDLPMLFKYLPMALAYDPPTGEIQAFMKKNGISVAELSKRVMQFLLSQASNSRQHNLSTLVLKLLHNI
jgi:hypothetical protein